VVFSEAHWKSGSISADFADCEFRTCSFDGTKIVGCSLERGKLDAVDFSETSLDDVTFADLSMTEVQWPSRQMRSVRFENVTFEDGGYRLVSAVKNFGVDSKMPLRIRNAAGLTTANKAALKQAGVVFPPRL
jgi:uncharacterized protein YjbI with pentapeptide repeats